jgi:hypothetical protein
MSTKAAIRLLYPFVGSLFSAPARLEFFIVEFRNPANIVYIDPHNTPNMASIAV